MVCIVADWVLPGAGYAMFAGREVARALALMSLDPDDCCAELADLTPRQLDTLQEWLDKFRQKYHSVGQVRPSHCSRLPYLALSSLAPAVPAALLFPFHIPNAPSHHLLPPPKLSPSPSLARGDAARFVPRPPSPVSAQKLH